LFRSFDDGSAQAHDDVPLDVAMEQPYAWIIGNKADDDVAAWVHGDGIPLHGYGRKVSRVAVEGS